MEELESKYDRLKAILREMDSVAVAYSGGVDSTFLLKVATNELGPNRVLGIIAVSESYPARELEEARKLAEEMGARIRLIETEELSNPDYARNPANRCFHCKTELFTKMFPVAQEEGLKQLLYGVNADDMGDFRPGIQAAKRMGARGPLQEAGLTKNEIRLLSRRLGLRTWDKPAYACLSSRIPYGQIITKEALLQVDAAENFLHDLGFRQVRVRHHDKIARIELPAQDMARLLSDGAAELVVAKLKELGYLYVTLDLQGYRTGSMNEVLRATQSSV
ncbi:MAG: ATP-dependent sacrificial sulfur transferase LarE [Actinobacteria bacterium]|nr:ATP-dependent sacrificial sulfur transferase LarE [Actinomycetota bacterium]